MSPTMTLSWLGSRAVSDEAPSPVIVPGGGRGQLHLHALGAEEASVIQPPTWWEALMCAGRGRGIPPAP
jgi:hypothetical protein